MGSEQGPNQGPPTTPSTIEAKVDSLVSKLDLLLDRGHGGCPVCLTCSLHIHQQETTEKHLSTQSKMLEKLGRRINEIQKVLEELVIAGGEKKHPSSSQELKRHMNLPALSQPKEAAGAMTTTVPAKTGFITLKNLDACPEQETNKSQSFQQVASATPLTKGNTEVKNPESALAGQKPIGGITEVAQPITAPSVVSTTAPSTPAAQKTKSTLAPKKLEVQASIQPPLTTHTKKTEGPFPGLVLVGGNSQDVKVQPLAEPLRKNEGGADATAHSLQVAKGSTTIAVKSEVQALKQPQLSTQTKKMVGPVAGLSLISGNSQEVKGQPMAEPLRQTEEETSVTVQSAKATPESKSSSGPGKSTKTMFGQNKDAKMVTSALVPPVTQKPCGLAVPMVTLESPSLRHVSSCPESLQRLQSVVPHAVSAPARSVQGPTPGKKSYPADTSSGPSPCPSGDCGIQICVFPAPPNTTKTTSMPPQICHKVIDDVPPQPAPFLHRFVSLSSRPASDFFNIHTREVLGGGRFGKVHRCTERSSGLKLAAKVINTRNAKEKEMALNEMQVMNQLSHANVLQLYEAFETKNQVILILEYVEGGELFDRIVDESVSLTEVDAMVFVKQICEGLHYMHQMYVLHLDLKPENILCVNRSGHQVKIIDFGLARRYRPREKLRINFGTPEFLAPEVVNFDFVSFPTDMWTLGVVTYMLVSGMSPFLGDDDSQTLSNVLAVNWYFDEEAFEHVSADAKDFISNLLIREKGGRMSATQCLKHPWLNNISEKAKHNNIVLKSQVLLKKYMAKRLWKKNYFAIAAANRLKKISSSGSLTSLGV